MYKKLSEPWNVVISQPMLGVPASVLEWHPQIISLQVTIQHETALEIKPLNVQNKGIFYILRLLPSSFFPHCTTAQGCNNSSWNCISNQKCNLGDL